MLNGLFQRGWTKEQIQMVFRLIDWLMRLPKQVDDEVWQEIQAFEQEKKMPFMTTPERIGTRAGLLMGIAALLDVRFSAAGRALFSEIEAIDDNDVLKKILEQAKTVASPNDLRVLWQSAS